MGREICVSVFFTAKAQGRKGFLSGFLFGTGREFKPRRFILYFVMQNHIVKQEHLNKLSSIVIDASVSVHKEMGPGLLESVYQQCLAKEFELRHVEFIQCVPIPLVYKGVQLNKDYVIDLLVENEIVVELQAVEGLLPVHDAQIISYLKLADKRLGFLINFNVPLLKHGFRRFVNGF